MGRVWCHFGGKWKETENVVMSRLWRVEVRNIVTDSLTLYIFHIFIRAFHFKKRASVMHYPNMAAASDSSIILTGRRYTS